MKTIHLKRNGIKYGIVLVAGMLIGWLLFGTGQPKKEDINASHVHAETDESVWTCSMHPQIRQQEPGDCPICGMDLIPLEGDEGGEDMPDVVTLSDRALALANVQTTIVQKAGRVLKKIRLQGKVEIDETQITTLPAHFPGRIEKLYVTFEGAQVKTGQKLADVYSPELVTAQIELLEAIRLEGSKSTLTNAARNKLRLWKISDEQIEAIISSDKVKVTLPVYAQSSGIVTKRNVSVGDYLNAGEVMFEIANINNLWVLFDAYQEDLPLIETGDRVEISISSIPDKQFSASVTYIDPIINPQTRVASVRAEISNPTGNLKPEMFAHGIIHSEIETTGEQLLVPASAVMWTGKRSIVYVRHQTGGQTSFRMRDIELGNRVNDSYLVASGLQTGEAVVTNGTFTVDAAAQLANKSSMMNQDAHVIQTSGHLQHDHAVMTGSESKQEKFFVAGNCSMCKERIEKAVTNLEGIHHAFWSADDKMLSVTYDPEKLDLMNIHHAVADVGHDTRKVRAEDEFYDNLHSCCKYERVQQTDDAKLKSTSFRVYGNCGMCKDRIESTAMALNGVHRASWNQETKALEITFHPEKVDLMDVHEAIAQAGHDTEKVKAPSDVYNDLPGCCQYTRKTEFKGFIRTKPRG